MSTIRKSNRTRTLTDKFKESNLTKTNQNQIESPALKKRRLNDEDDHDKIDPVEKLLSLTTFNNDILLDIDQEQQQQQEEEDGEESDSEDSEYESEEESSNISLNFSKILNENIRNYYSNLKRCPIEIYNDNSSFALLNKQQQPQEQPKQPPQQQEVPFFKNVNFNPKPQSAYTFDEYLSYDDDEPTTPSTPTVLPNNKMSFHYRHHDNLNLSTTNHSTNEPQDIFKILNKSK
ncbi:hypothetical protein QCA50_020995 [Cerrena zonata]|uniref:Uncharacterized protein n=1 Tax=Cerrena zonata TaxID=2478898 RepID=A0AAW0FAK4_9APHY